MAINYNLTIGSLGRKLVIGDLENVVYEVSVGVTAQSEEYPQFTYSCGGNITLNIDELDGDAFIPFEDVTQEIVVGWLLAKEGVESVDDFSYVKSSVYNIQQRIDDLSVEDSVSVAWSITNAPAPTVSEPVDENILQP